MKFLRRTVEGNTSPEARLSLGADAASDLLATIHERIVPQLILVHAAADAELGFCPATRLPPTSQEVAAFAGIAVAEELEAALAFIKELCDGGISVEVILLDLVAPAARLLGDDWTDDRRSLTEVTAGLAILHRVLHVLGPSTQTSDSNRGFIVLVAAPQEQHTLGIFMLAEFLRKDGWNVRVDANMPVADLLEVVRRENVDMVGISVSNTDLVGPLRQLVAAVRKASMNRDLAVMVGGSLILASQAEEIGATFSNDPNEVTALLARHAARRPT